MCNLRQTFPPYGERKTKPKDVFIVLHKISKFRNFLAFLKEIFCGFSLSIKNALNTLILEHLEEI